MEKKLKVDPSDHLHHLAFDNSMLPNIISVVKDGKIIAANESAGKLLGYSKKTLISKNIKDILTVSKHGLKQLSERMEKAGNEIGNLTVIKKSGKQLPCQITSVEFMGDNHIQKAITTMVDRSEGILKQNNIDIIKDKRLDKEISENDQLQLSSKLQKIEFDSQREEEVKLKEIQIADAVAEAKELERSDIGKELHDNVNQLLVASGLYVEMARKNKTQKETYLQKSSEYIKSAIEEIRKLTKGIISDAINNTSLCEAISHISQSLMEVNPVKICCAIDDKIQALLIPRFNLNVFRIVQEQLTNIIKHASASVVKISLVQNKNTLILCVSDNGSGFDLSKKSGGIGITNIKSRAAFYKGKTSLISKPGKGCILTIKFPIRCLLLNDLPNAALLSQHRN